MTSATFWFVPVEGGTPGTIAAEVTAHNVGEVDYVAIPTQSTTVILRNAIEDMYAAKNMESVIGGSDNRRKCFLAAKVSDDVKPEPRQRSIRVRDGIYAGTYHELKPGAVIPPNSDDNPLVLIYPARTPAVSGGNNNSNNNNDNNNSSSNNNNIATNLNEISDVVNRAIAQSLRTFGVPLRSDHGYISDAPVDYSSIFRAAENEGRLEKDSQCPFSGTAPDDFLPVSNAQPGSPEVEVQKFVNSAFDGLTLSYLRYVDTHATAGSPGPKPDCSFFPILMNNSRSNVVVLGELKARTSPNKTAFSPDQKGQVLSTGAFYLGLQPWRAAMYYFLTDLDDFQLFKITRVTEVFHLVEYPVVEMKTSGRNILHALLHSDLQALSFDIPTAPPAFRGLQPIASGATSVVFAPSQQPGRTNSPEFVVKVFRPRYTQDHALAEVDTLNAVKCDWVPNVISSGENYIQMRYCGTPLGGRDSNFQTPYLTGVVNALRYAHMQGYVHRDVRPPNIVWDDTKTVLVDWGFAVKIGSPESKRFAGSLRFASTEILEDPDRAFTPADDLVSLVKTYWYLKENELPFDRYILFAKGSRESLQQFWRTEYTPPFIQLFDAAKGNDYDEIIRLLTPRILRY